MVKQAFDKMSVTHRAALDRAPGPTMEATI
jgi:hypothetical protein